MNLIEVRFLDKGITGFGIQKLQTKFILKDSKNIAFENLNYEGHNWII